MARRNGYEPTCEKKCPPCDEATASLAADKLRKLQQKLNNPEWKIPKGHHLERHIKFKDFKAALACTNKIGEVAEEMGHHPNICLAWGEVKIQIWTHKINGLTENDFVLAAKIDEALGQ